MVQATRLPVAVAMLPGVIEWGRALVEIIKSQTEAANFTQGNHRQTLWVTKHMPLHGMDAFSHNPIRFKLGISQGWRKHQ